jgi:drug/metabolite transporter (DMT)-like permease
MANGIIAGIVLVIFGIMLIAIGGNFFTQASISNQTTGQTPATQMTSNFGVAFVAGGSLSLICGIIVIFKSFGGGGFWSSRYRE